MMSSVIGQKDYRFYRIVTLSNELAPIVLRRGIKQYCDVHRWTFQDFLEFHKHELFHFRKGATGPCCLSFHGYCKPQNFNRVLLDEQWNTLYMLANLPPTDAHSGHDAKKCPHVFSARNGIDFDVCDISLASALLTNITGQITTTHVEGIKTKTPLTAGFNLTSGSGLLEYTLDLLSASSGYFEGFLKKYQHDLFHCVEKNRCCQCTGTTNPDEKNRITLGDWNTMYNSSPTPCIWPVCSHKYSPKPCITRASLTTQLIHKIGQAVGPVVTVRSVRNQIAHSTTATMDSPTFTAKWKEMSGALHELIDIVATDPAWQKEMKSKIANLETSSINEEDCRRCLEVLYLEHKIYFSK